MTIVKTVQFRQNLKQFLEKIYDGDEQDFFLDYYGKLFKIVPVTTKSQTKTQAQTVVEYFSSLKPRKLTDPIFDEANPSQEKENFRNLRYAKYDK